MFIYKGSNTGLLAGIGVVSAIAVGGLGAAAYLFWKLKNVSKFPTFTDSHSSKPPTNARLSFAQPNSMRGVSSDNFGGNSGGSGVANPAFSNSTEPPFEAFDVITHPGKILS